MSNYLNGCLLKFNNTTHGAPDILVAQNDFHNTFQVENVRAIDPLSFRLQFSSKLYLSAVDEITKFAHKHGVVITGIQDIPDNTTQAYNIDGNNMMCCRKCGSFDVFQLEWVNPNNQQLKEDRNGTEGLEAWCSGCMNTTTIISAQDFVDGQIADSINNLPADNDVDPFDLDEVL